MNILVTGAAGFIGSALSTRLCSLGHKVVGVDNLSPYYDVKLKRDRILHVSKNPLFTFIEGDLKFSEFTNSLFANSSEPFSHVAHMAAQPGVRYSLQNPHAYLDANLAAFLNILEACRHHKVQHLAFASSSSVYGANGKMPFSEHHSCEHPVSLYAATKKANEMMAHSYSHTFGLPVTGLRFFTVYGPWGRPDMAAFSFTDKILRSEPIPVFNRGHHKRDFTYVDDVVESVAKVILKPALPNPNWSSQTPDPATSTSPYRIYNIGNQQPVELMVFIRTLEEVIGRKAILEFTDMAQGDVHETFATTADLERDFQFKPNTSLRDGLQRFFDWYRNYYKIS